MTELELSVEEQLIRHGLTDLSTGAELIFNGFDTNNTQIVYNLCLTCISILFALRTKSPNLFEMIVDSAIERARSFNFKEEEVL